MKQAEIGRKDLENPTYYREHKAVPSSSGFEEYTNVKECSQRGHTLSFEGLGDFIYFQITNRVVGVIVGVVVCDDGASFLDTTLTNKPAGLSAPEL